MAPHSSASTWPNVIQRSDSTGTMRFTASETSGKSWRMPVWKSSGSSATTRDWLKGMLTSSTQVEMRWMPSAISCVVVSIMAPSVFDRCARCVSVRARVGEVHVDDLVDQAHPAGAARLVGQLLVDDAAHQCGVEVEVAALGEARGG